MCWTVTRIENNGVIKKICSFDDKNKAELVSQELNDLNVYFKLPNNFQYEVIEASEIS